MLRLCLLQSCNNEKSQVSCCSFMCHSLDIRVRQTTHFITVKFLFLVLKATRNSHLTILTVLFARTASFVEELESSPAINRRTISFSSIPQSRTNLSPNKQFQQFPWKPLQTNLINMSSLVSLNLILSTIKI